jgi:hypothetical protein
VNRDDTGPGSEFAAPPRRLIFAAIFVLLITLAV